ncbi:MAG: glycosyltransferase, partial [Chthoniobacteraceae bacterium]
IIHFVFGLSEDFGGRPFSLIHYLAIRSAHDCNQPEIIYFHYAHEPSGEWWGKAKSYLTLHKIEPLREIFGNPLLHYAHMADVIRLDALLKYGGIYLDMDVLCVKSFVPLLHFEAVMGDEGPEGLCNAVIMSEPGAAFIRRWYEEYRTFRSKGKDDYWNEHSVQRPRELAKKYRNEIHIESRFSFFWPGYLQFPLLFGVAPHRPLFQRLLGHLVQPLTYLIVKRRAYCIHLYESLWWDKYLKTLTPDSIRKRNRSFEWLFSKFLP